MNRLVVRAAAEADIDEIADYYARRAGPDVALAFYAAVEPSWEALRAQPHLGAERSWLSGLLESCRRWPLSRPFEVYQVYYFDRDGTVDVIRVIHGARDRSSLGLTDR